METSFLRLTGSVSAVKGVDASAVADVVLCAGILGLQREIDRLNVIQAGWLHAGDTGNVWVASGHRDMASWFAAKGKTSVRHARDQAALGAGLAKHADLEAQVAAGKISADAAQALLPVLDGAHSGDPAVLLDACDGATPVEAKAAAARFRALNPPPGETPADRENELRAKRFLAFPDNPDGTHNVVGNLSATDARTVETALASIAGKPCPGDDRSYGQRLADALVQLCGAYSRGEVKGGRSNLPTVLVVIDVNDLNRNMNGNTHGTSNGAGYTSRGDGPGYTSRGDVISAEAVRRMCWNADIARILMNGSVPLDLGRSQRLASNDQWRALVVRDGGCRMVDCQIPAEWCQVDHIREWDAEHGTTDIDLLVLWCVFHHGFRHRKDVTLIGDANDLSIRLPDGMIVPLPPRGPTHHDTTKPKPKRSQNGTPEPGRPPDQPDLVDQPDLFDDPAAA